jgi:hypothetical protein
VEADVRDVLSGDAEDLIDFFTSAFEGKPEAW